MYVSQSTEPEMLLWHGLPIPDEVRVLMSYLDDCCPLPGERRSNERFAFKMRAAIALASQLDGAKRLAPVYTRDANNWGLGFLCHEELPIGRSAELYLPLVLNRRRRIPGTILRCSSYIDGWFDGAFVFDQEQPGFCPHGAA